MEPTLRNECGAAKSQRGGMCSVRLCRYPKPRNKAFGSPRLVDLVCATPLHASCSHDAQRRPPPCIVGTALLTFYHRQASPINSVVFFLLASMQTSTRNPAPASSNDTAVSRELVAVLVVLVNPQMASDQLRFEQLQALRRRHDRAFDHWLPHITLVPPVILALPDSSAQPPHSEVVTQALLELHGEKLSQIAATVQTVCERHERHELLLDQVSTFPSRMSTNVHLRPYPTNFTDRGTSSAPSSRTSDHDSRRIVQLQADLEQALAPLLSNKGIRSNQRTKVYKPHVSVGQSNYPKATWQLCSAAERVLRRADGQEGLMCNVDRVQLMIKRKGDAGAYQVYKEVLLSGSTQS